MTIIYFCLVKQGLENSDSQSYIFISVKGWRTLVLKVTYFSREWKYTNANCQLDAKIERNET